MIVKFTNGIIASSVKRGNIIAVLILCLSVSIGYSQSLPIDFESGVTTADFVDFDGGTATVIANPQSGGINTSATVAQIVRNGGAPWGGSKIELSSNLDFSTQNRISMKVYTSAPVGTIVKFKLEGTGEAEKDAVTTVSNEWETLEWDFTGQPMNFNNLVFMFDFNNIGDGSANSTFLFDDIEQLSGGSQIDLPVTFEDTGVDYTMGDFGGNASALVIDPTDASNQVMEVIKTNMAAGWAGTTIGTDAGFATNIPLTLNSSKMNVRVWSPDAGITVRLKVEDANDVTHTCETNAVTTVAGEWETLEFDFAEEAPGTAQLSVGLSMGWVYNKASIFFNFGVEGATAGEKTYYFDDVRFGELSTSINNTYELQGLKVFPNPASDHWVLSLENTNINKVEIFDMQGKSVQTLQPGLQEVRINANEFVSGTYIARISTSEGSRSIRLVKR